MEAKSHAPRRSRSFPRDPQRGGQDSKNAKRCGFVITRDHTAALWLARETQRIIEQIHAVGIEAAKTKKKQFEGTIQRSCGMDARLVARLPHESPPHFANRTTIPSAPKAPRCPSMGTPRQPGGCAKFRRQGIQRHEIERHGAPREQSQLPSVVLPGITAVQHRCDPASLPCRIAAFQDRCFAGEPSPTSLNF